MERYKFANKRILIAFILLFLTGIVTCMIPVSVLILHNIPAISYLTIIIMWALMIRYRILDRDVRTRITAACTFMGMLFILRMSKFSFFPDLPDIEELIWYAYYIPMTAIPMCIFMATLRVKPIRNMKKVDVTENLLLIGALLIWGVVMTNGTHGMVFDITVHPGKEYTRGWFYFVILLWMIILGISSIYILFKKCSLSAARKRWFVPVSFIIVGCVLLFWYLINGGSPKIDGHKLFQLQEAYCFPFIMAVESIIQIGVIPANTGYERLFDLSGVEACIYDKRGETVLASRSWDENRGDDDHRICYEPISGGKVAWVEDLTELNELNRRLEDVAEEIEDENELIRKENDIRSERVSFETKNRLYNRIAASVRPQALRVNELLKKAAKDDEGSKDELIYAAVLSSYIKRMGNLILLTDTSSELGTDELFLALKESLDYIGLRIKACDILKSGQMKLPSALVLLSYELFETAIEDVWLRLRSVAVNMECAGEFTMTIALDTPAEAITAGWNERRVREAGGRIETDYEDETYYIRLTTAPADPDPVVRDLEVDV